MFYKDFDKILIKVPHSNCPSNHGGYFEFLELSEFVHWQEINVLQTISCYIIALVIFDRGVQTFQVQQSIQYTDIFCDREP